MSSRAATRRKITYTTQKQAMPKMTCSMPRSEETQANRVFVLQQPISTALDGIIMMLPTAHTPEMEPSPMNAVLSLLRASQLCP